LHYFDKPADSPSAGFFIFWPGQNSTQNQMLHALTIISLRDLSQLAYLPDGPIMSFGKHLISRLDKHLKALMPRTTLKLRWAKTDG
jgi:hypothetical protein